MIQPGSKVAHYEIVSALGKGGMGEVWRARDTKLGREVAIKTLPAEFAEDADRLARFEREAKLLASLNHPNIAAIYGLEEHEGSRFLVLELVEGDTLAARLQRGAIPVEEALKLALQTSEALEAAHDKGVIHRDLKPANIKVTPDGKVKVLDFGLAKAFAGKTEEANLSQSPTLSMAATQQGIILGTASYMSPEQAKGRATDRRTDIWAFGCVLTEMLTGRAAFPGDDVSDVLASVLKMEPDWSGFPANLNPRLRELLERCLEKDARKRYRDIGDVGLDIEKALTSPVTDTNEQQSTPVTRHRVLVGVLVVAVTAVVLSQLPGSEPTVGPVRRLLMTIPPGLKLDYFNPPIAVSPDGDRVVYGIRSGGSSQLYLRDLNDLDAQPIPGTSGATNPFFSPDGQWLGFERSEEEAIYKIRLAEGTPQLVCNCLPNQRGVFWGPNNTIVYSPRVNFGGVWQVSAEGGQEVELTAPGIGRPSHRWPQLVDDGQLLIYTEGDEGEWDISNIVAQRLGTDDPPITLVEGATFGRYLTTGHLIYFRDETLLATPLDLESLETGTEEVRLIEGVSQHGGSGAPLAAFSGTGTLLYVEKSVGDYLQSSSPTWVDATTGEPESFGPYHSYSFHDLSPDGRSVALQVRGPTGGIFVYDIETDNLIPFLTRPQRAGIPLWVGTDRVAFSDGAAGGSLSWLRVDLADAAERIDPSNGLVIPTSVSSDGRWLVYTVRSLTGSADDIWMIELGDDGAYGEPTPFLETPDFEGGGKISPDGEWLAYTSDSSGRYEVYVQKFPERDQPRRVSSDGGQQPVWSPSGTELFYLLNDRSTLMSAGILLDPAFRVERAPTEVLEFGDIEQVLPPVTSVYHVSPDGERFMVTKATEPPSEPTPVVVVQNWFEELKERVPVP